jgi:uncharacterized membrane protein
MRFSFDVLWPLVGLALLAIGVDRLSSGSATAIGLAAVVLGLAAVAWGIWRLKQEHDRGRTVTPD